MKVLLARPDRLGDLVLSLPAVDLLTGARPDWEVHLLVAPAAVPLVDHHPGVARVWTWHDRLDRAARDDLREALRAESFDAAVLLQYRRELALLLRAAGIAPRYGPLSRFSSWLLLDRGRRQGRSRGDRHEADMGAELVAPLAGAPAAAAPLPRLHPAPEALAAGRAFRAERAADADVVCFVHPGSGGSALDWPPEAFAAAAATLAARPGWRVFVTGAGGDRAAVEAVRRGLDDRIEILLDAFDLRTLLGVLAAGDALVGPSTGPLHLAAALDLAAVGLYPPVRTMAPARWGPRGRWVRTLVPEVVCPAGRTCLGERCVHWNCMELVAPAAAAAAVVDLVARRRAAGADEPGRKERKP